MYSANNRSPIASKATRPVLRKDRIGNDNDDYGGGGGCGDEGGDVGGLDGGGHGLGGADSYDKKVLKNVRLFFCGSFDRISEPRFPDEDKLPKLTSLRK